MKRSKKIFIAVSVIFFLAVVAVTIDISRKTTFPGSKKHLPESILPSDTEKEAPTDTVETAQAAEKN